MIRSIAFRIALRASALALVAVVALAVMTLATVRDATTRMLDTTVATDTTGLIDIYASGGEAELARRIADRVAWEAAGQRSRYLLLRGTRRIAGDLTRPSPLDASRSQRGYIMVDGQSLYAQATALAPGVTLHVARSFPAERALLARLALAFAFVGGAVVLASALLALRAARKLEGRVTTINAAYATAEPGAIGALGAETAHDEIGQLARNSGNALARLAALVDAQRHISDQIAHEIRTPLSRLDRQLAAIGSQSAQAKDAMLARTQIASITALLDSLLDIAANEARRGDRRGLTTVDLSELVSAFDDLYRPSLEDAGLRFKLAVEPAIVFEGNAMDLRRMISNLLDNVIRHVPPGRSVALELARGPKITVRDDGPGIPEPLRAHVFDRFARSDGGGHGLGLALVRAIAERHGLAARLGDGEGTAIVIEPAAA